MKKYIGTFVVWTILASFAGAQAADMWDQARFANTTIDPVCSISGESFTTISQGKSDTSDWMIPTAYDGNCIETQELTSAEQDRIFAIMKSYFKKNNYYSGTNTWEAYRDEALNEKGRSYIKKSFFPAIVQKIQKQKDNNSADSKTVAVLNYAASVIGYDYYIFQAERN